MPADNEKMKFELFKAICNWLIRKGMMSGKECFVIARADGSTVAFRKGSKTNVLLGSKVEELLEMSDKDRFIFYHNHPFSKSFSFLDMRTLNYYDSLKEMVAVGHDGTVFSLKAGKRLSDKDFVVLFKDITESNALEKLVKNYKWKYTDSRKL